MRIHSALAAAAILAVLTQGVEAAGEGRSFQVKNRLRFEYDDNIYERSTQQEESFKIIEELEFLVNLNLESAFVGLRYRPTFVWWDNREPDDTDLHHDVDAILTVNFSPRLSLSLKDTLRLAEQPDQIDRGATIRERDDFLYNVTDGVLSFVVAPGTRLEGAGRYTVLQYERDEVAAVEDYDIVAAGVNLRHELMPSTSVAGELRYEEIEYDGPDRGSISEYAGIGLEQVFSPALLGNVRGGVQFKDFNNDAIDEETAPYADGSLTFLPSPATRLTAGAGYSLFESDVYPYTSQDRTLLYLSLGHDVTARLSIYLAGSYQLGEYKGDQSLEQTAGDGDETVKQFSARASWKVNRSNWLELGWQYLDLTSDLREEYDRNRAEVGWRTQI